MERRDYLLREIAALGRLVARLAGLKAASRLEEAARDLRDETGRLLGLDPKLLELVDPPSLPDIFRSGSDLDAARCLAAAELFREGAEILDLQQRHEEAIDRRLRSVACYLAVYLHPDGQRTPDLATKLETLVSQVTETQLPAELSSQLAAFRGKQ